MVHMVQEPESAEIDTNQLEQVTAAVQESEWRFRAIFNQTWQLMGFMKLDGTVIEVNQAALNFGGLDRATLIGRPFWEASWWTISPQTQDELQGAIAVAAQGECIRYEVDVLSAGNEIATIDFSIQPIRDQSEQVVLLAWEGRDISNYKRAEAEIRQLKAQLQQSVNAPTALEELPQAETAHNLAQALQSSDRRYTTLAKMSPVGIFHTDAVGNCLYVNERWCEIAGFTSEQALGMGWVAAIHPEDRQQVMAKWNQSVQKKLPFCAEYRFQQPGGKTVWLLGQAVAETEENGETIGYIGTVIDITERKQAEQALWESEERFQAMADTAPVMIWMSGTDGLRDDFNKKWLEFTGRTIAQELGNGWAGGVHPDDLERCLDTYTRAFDARQPFKMEYRLSRFDGEYRWVLDTGTPRWNADGSFAGYIGSCIDISDRKQTELNLTRMNAILAQTTAMLNKRNDELDQFAYVASHDLKAPLRAIANLSEWIEEDLQDQLTEENQKQMDLLRKRVRRMEALIDGLLEYSRVGRIQTPVSVVNVGELLQEVIESLAPPPTFSIDIQPGMPTLKTKRLLLQQVFTNLIGNAIVHHTRPDGHVKISVQDRNDYYEFAVTDDGPGIAPEYQDKVFVIFQTLAARDCKESAGMGLAIVKKIVETETGAIALDSLLGAGSTFRFTWPKQPRE
ncbi:MAG: PAS domain S-box protein [Fischerella sp.]|nr:PAS domain S-box protein [Fischerella sp.]